VRELLARGAAPNLIDKVSSSQRHCFAQHMTWDLGAPLHGAVEQSLLTVLLPGSRVSTCSSGRGGS
jgi:hypothetical protein